ncbi:MAG: DUF4105 domain-containing protein [Methylophilus sp.]|nr:DUF4105 domain-containing protein [Methylophilus sp.]
MIAIILLATCWGALAIYFGNSNTSWIQTILAIGFALSGLLTIFLLGTIRFRWRMLVLFGILFVCVVLWWMRIQPSNDRQWQQDVEKIAYATVEGDLVTVWNVRNFNYKSEFEYQPAYFNKTYDLSKLESADLFTTYWMGPAIAHTMLSFNFGEGGHLAISIEARKEEGESYSSIKGFFKQYELIYIAADERDLVRLRTNYRKNPVEDVYLYAIHWPKKDVKKIFLQYIYEINRLNDQPAFYNSLVENCTTMIWIHTLVNQDHLKFSWKILASGFYPEYLYENGQIDQSLPFSEIQKRAHINVLANNADQASDFSKRIREKPNAN